MQIRIFQIDTDYDDDSLNFLSLEKALQRRGGSGIDSSIYEEVFRGDLDCADPEEIFDIFNRESHPLFRGHSLSVSDVVLIEGNAPLLAGVIRKYSASGSCTTASYTDPKLFAADIAKAYEEKQDVQVEDYRGQNIPVIENGAYFCDSIGFSKVEFDPALAHKRDDLLQIVYVEPGRAPFVSDVGSDLLSMQKAVRGPLDTLYNRDGTVLISNDESKRIGMKGNRHVGDSIIAGPFFIVGDSGETFRSLTDSEVERYMERFAQPEDISQEDVEEDSEFTFMDMR